MPGSITFKPIEAHLTHDTELITKMDPYCVFLVGNKAFNSEVSKKGGKHPQWTDAITVPISNESSIDVNLILFMCKVERRCFFIFFCWQIKKNSEFFFLDFRKNDRNLIDSNY